MIDLVLVKRWIDVKTVREMGQGILDHCHAVRSQIGENGGKN